MNSSLRKKFTQPRATTNLHHRATSLPLATSTTNLGNTICLFGKRNIPNIGLWRPFTVQRIPSVFPVARVLCPMKFNFTFCLPHCSAGNHTTTGHAGEKSGSRKFSPTAPRYVLPPPPPQLPNTRSHPESLTSFNRWGRPLQEEALCNIGQLDTELYSVL